MRGWLERLLFDPAPKHPWTLRRRPTLLERLVAAFQRRCPHPPELVVADILEGDAIARHGPEEPAPPDVQVQHCRRCGAVKRAETDYGERSWEGEWRVPEATIGSWVHVIYESELDAMKAAR